MASPVSFGDAYLMAQLAYKLGKAFTKGQKSAPAEFLEVESQLLSLSTALSSVARRGDKAGLRYPSSLPTSTYHPDQQRAEEEQCIDDVLVRSWGSLKHLENLVAEYGSIARPEAPKSPLLQFRAYARVNWKKIKWTTEGGDLAKLIRQLSIHTNALNLLLGVVNRSQIQHIDTGVEEMSKMLKEIYAWFSENLKTSPASRTNTTATQSFDVLSASQEQLTTFELSTTDDLGSTVNLLCSRVGLNPEWSERLTGGARASLFDCHCAAVTTPNSTHSGEVASYKLSELAFPIRLAGRQRTWLIFKALDARSNKLVSLMVKSTSAHGLQYFERDFVQRLANLKSESMLLKGDQNFLVHVDTHNRTARQLHLLVDATGKNHAVKEISFRRDEAIFTRAGPRSIHMLHYNNIGVATEDGSLAIASESLKGPVNSAELVISFEEEFAEATGEVDKMVLHRKITQNVAHSQKLTTVVERTTSVKVNDNVVELHDILASGSKRPTQTADLPRVQVKIVCTGENDAGSVHRKIKAMQMELFIMHLKHRREHEQVILTIHSGHFCSRDVEFSDATITFLQDLKTKVCRLIVESGNGRTLISHELATRNSNSSTDTHGPDPESTTFLVQLNDLGETEVRTHSKGLGRFDFTDRRDRELFQLALVAALDRASQGRIAAN